MLSLVLSRESIWFNVIDDCGANVIGYATVGQPFVLEIIEDNLCDGTEDALYHGNYGCLSINNMPDLEFTWYRVEVDTNENETEIPILDENGNQITGNQLYFTPYNYNEHTGLYRVYMVVTGNDNLDFCDDNYIDYVLSCSPTAPVPITPILEDIVAECEVSENDVTPPTAIDNCNGTVMITHNVTFPITQQGTTVITWTFTNTNGNITTQTQNVIIDCNLSVDNPDTSTEINVYPNPFSDVVILSSNQNLIENVKIYDIKGGLLYENNYNTNEISIDLSHFTTGIYFIKTFSEQKEITHKLVKK